MYTKEQWKIYSKNWRKNHPITKEQKRHKAEYDKIYNKKNRKKKLLQCRINYYKDTKGYIEKVKKWRASHIENCRESARKWKSNNRSKRFAQAKIQYRIRKGIIERKPCIKCGKLPSEAHHPDYRKPLYIIWLCRKHHKIAHRKYSL